MTCLSSVSWTVDLPGWFFFLLCERLYICVCLNEAALHIDPITYTLLHPPLCCRPAAAIHLWAPERPAYTLNTSYNGRDKEICIHGIAWPATFREHKWHIYFFIHILLDLLTFNEHKERCKPKPKSQPRTESRGCCGLRLLKTAHQKTRWCFLLCLVLITQ